MQTPIVFVHGNGDTAALWHTTIWRFESNGYPRDLLFAIDFTYPQGRADDAVPMAGRSSSADQLRELSAFVAKVRAVTG
ncbi:MAG: twin-arginine translocation pathway signal, partial [Casimicrobiaceae bacterium]